MMCHFPEQIIVPERKVRFGIGDPIEVSDRPQPTYEIKLFGDTDS